MTRHPESGENGPSVRAVYGKLFKIGYEDTVRAYPELKFDPDYQEILCRKRADRIYAFSAKDKGGVFGPVLAYSGSGKGKIAPLSKIVENHPRKAAFYLSGSDLGEFVFLFNPILFDQVAEVARPRKRRQVSEAQRQAAKERFERVWAERRAV